MTESRSELNRRLLSNIYADDYIISKSENCIADYSIEDLIDIMNNPDSTLKQISCLFDDMIFSSILKYFADNLENTKFLGSGISGRALYFELGNIRFIIKNMPLENTHKILREVFNALQINKVIEDTGIPNFCYFLGYFINNSLIKQVFDLEFSAGIFYEFIQGKDLAYEIVNGLSGFGSVSCFFQILFALSIAFDEVGFIHGDLHGHNIIVRHNPDGYIDYTFRGKNYRLKTHQICTIIDYENSDINLTNTYRGVSQNCINDLIDLSGEFNSENGSFVWTLLYNLLNKLIFDEKVLRNITEYIPPEYMSINYGDILSVFLECNVKTIRDVRKTIMQE
jgi:hypothetical protein